MVLMFVPSSLSQLSDANFPSVVAWKVHITSGSLIFFKIKYKSWLVWLPRLHKTNSKGHHSSFVCFRKALCPMDVNSVNSRSKALLHQDVIDLVMEFCICAVPCVLSGCFVKAKGICQY